MKQTVYESDFTDAFKSSGRGEQFSYDGLKALYNWLIEMEDGCAEETELDVIALCCEFCEYKDLAEFQADYSTDYETIEDIEEATTVIKIDDDSFIIQCF